jgi:hypothetical protein
MILFVPRRSPDRNAKTFFGPPGGKENDSTLIEAIQLVGRG